MTHALCPHCHSVLPGVALPGPPAGLRCPHCSLVVAAGRALDPAQAAAVEPSASAASLAARRARRTDVERADVQRVAASLRRVAAELGVPVGRLAMLDYDRAARADPTLAPLTEVLSAHETWRSARARVAAES